MPGNDLHTGGRQSQVLQHALQVKGLCTSPFAYRQDSSSLAPLRGYNARGEHRIEFRAFAGTLNPSSGDVSVFLPLEHARLAEAAHDDTRTTLFARYSLLGALFALSFCPISAALFFGSLIPLAVKQQSYVLLPTLYGIGTGLPVIVFGVVLAVSAHSIGRIFTRVTKVEKWLRRITGIVFIGVGVYYCLIYYFGVEM